MPQFKFVQTWDTAAYRKQEYATFIAGEFLPSMKVSGLEVDSGWYTLLGGSPHIFIESLAGSLKQIETALQHLETKDMLERLKNLVYGYSSYVLESARAEIQETPGKASQRAAKFLKVWDVIPGEREALEKFMNEELFPGMAQLGLEVTEAWRVVLGSGPRFILEATTPDLFSIFDAVGDERYLRLIMRIEELIARHENRVMVRHDNFVDLLNDIYGRAIREIPADEFNSMVGPVGE